MASTEVTDTDTDTDTDTGTGTGTGTGIGISGMVEGGIFAILGLSIELAQGAALPAFLIAGGVTYLTSVFYARLTAAFPSRGGKVTFLNEVVVPESSSVDSTYCSGSAMS